MLPASQAIRCLPAFEKRAPHSGISGHVVAQNDAERHVSVSGCLARTRTCTKSSKIEASRAARAPIRAPDEDTNAHELAEVVANWHKLPFPLKSAVLAIVRSFQAGNDQQTVNKRKQDAVASASVKS
jgi:hypothetical protein